jgi:ElaB/YqjD/DUF883 family membrane-anchored ribosome-binding protein
MMMATQTERNGESLSRTVQEAVETIGLDLAKTGRDAGEALSKARKVLNASAAHAMEDIEAQGAQAVEGLKQQVREHPMTYIAAAAGIGLLIGFLMQRR